MEIRGQFPLGSRELWKTGNVLRITITKALCVMLRNINFLMQPIGRSHYVHFR